MAKKDEKDEKDSGDVPNRVGADSDNRVKKSDKVIEVPEKVLIELQERMAALELENTEKDNKMAGLEEMVRQGNTSGEAKLREKKNFEPKFRTLRIRKYPMFGDHEKMGYIVGWSSRGAYQEVDRSGISPQLVDYIDVFYLGHEKGENGKLQAEKIKLLDMLNKGVQVNCKILDVQKKSVPAPTGEEISINVWDPQHGLVSTGETIDGYVVYTEEKYQIQIPGWPEPVWVDAQYCNA